ncbi:hypothetical protein V760_02591 [Staphylococcus aureus F23613]|nr:hypothetical protein V760_02591 [Staphylococcus aureus F23613]
MLGLMIVTVGFIITVSHVSYCTKVIKANLQNQ